MQEYIPIDSFGLCLQNVPPTAFTRNTDFSRLILTLPIPLLYKIYKNIRYEDKIKLFQNYKFVLAFENSNTSDYVRYDNIFSAQ